MRPTSLLWFALPVLASSVAASGQAKPQPHFEIRGTLVSSADGSAVVHGHLVPTLVARAHSGRRQFPSPIGTFDTDESGRFVIPLPSAGEWNLVASARGFTRQAYQEHEEFSTAVVVSNVAPTMSIKFALSPEAEITGLVVDEAGEPVRKASVSLIMAQSLVPGQTERRTASNASTMTDDRGEFEFDGLAPGDYRICVEARPWYAQPDERGQDGSPPLDPSLDVTYAPTWFPGVGDPDAAEMLTMNAGDHREADIRLLPIPAVHLLITPSAGGNEASGSRSFPFVPVIQRVDPATGGQSFVPLSFNRTAQGQIDVDGLSPGLYQIRTGRLGPQGPGEENRSALVEVSAGPAQTLDLSSATNEAHVTLHIDGLPDLQTGSLQVSLLAPESGRTMLSSNPDGGFRGRSRGANDGPARKRTLEVPPGRYEVVLRGRPDLYLTGISAKGAEASGRIVSVVAGDCSLTLHIAQGRTNLTGFARFNAKPSVGAVVLLVPATLGDPGAIDIVRRDQTNTDGSFDLREVIPGQYILIAVDHGWEINWSDPSTMRRYLTQGVPLNLTAGADVKQNIVAQAP